MSTVDKVLGDMSPKFLGVNVYTVGKGAKSAWGHAPKFLGTAWRGCRKFFLLLSATPCQCAALAGRMRWRRAL